MKSPENIEKLIMNAEIHSNPDVNQAVLENLKKEFDVLEEEQKAPVTPPNIRRIFMKSSITKIAAAAVIISAVGFGLFEFIDTDIKSGVIWADVARKVQASRGVVFCTTEHIVPDTYDQESDFNMQYCTSTQSRLDEYEGGEIIKTIWGNCNTKTAILVDHYHKSYVKMILETTMPDRLQTADPNTWIQKFLSCPYKKLGQKTIDGVLCEGIETTDPAFYGGGNPPETPVARLWVSVETGYPVQLEGERVYDGQRHTFVQDQFQWDVELDKSLFDPKIPNGYIDISP